MSTVPSFVLPPDPGPGEARVWWDDTDEGACLHVWGTRDVRRTVLALLDEPRLELTDDFRRAAAARADGTVTLAPSVAGTLEAIGFDVKTLVLSVRKTAAPPTVDAGSADLPGLLGAALEELRGLSRLAGRFESAKEVYVLDEDDRDAVLAGIDRAEALVARAAAVAKGDAHA